MLLIAENIPATSETVPLIVVYLTTNMSLTSISIILTVIVLQVHHKSIFTPAIPKNFYHFMTRKIARVIGMHNTVERYEALSISSTKNKCTHLRESPCNSITRTSSMINRNLLTLDQNTRRTSKVENTDDNLNNQEWCDHCVAVCATETALIDNMNKIFEKLNFTANENKQTEWKLIALIIDRLLFWGFTIMTLISSLLLLIILPVLKHYDII